MFAKTPPPPPGEYSRLLKTHPIPDLQVIEKGKFMKNTEYGKPVGKSQMGQERPSNASSNLEKRWDQQIGAVFLRKVR